MARVLVSRSFARAGRDDVSNSTGERVGWLRDKGRTMSTHS